MNGERKNILLIIPSLSGGGAERVTINLANALAPDHNVTLVYFTDKGRNYPIDEKVNLVSLPTTSRPFLKHRYGQAVYALPETSPIRIAIHKVYVFLKGPGDARFVQKLKKELHIDVAISMLERPNYINGLTKGCKRIMSERNDPSSKEDGYYEGVLRSFRKAERIVFQTEAVQKQFPKSIQKKGVIIRNPVSVEAIDYQVNSKKIVSVGRLHEQKNYPMLIKAFSEFHKEHGDYHLHIYGTGNDADMLQQLIRDLDLEEAVTLEGFRQDIHEAIADAEMFILSSNYEGLPNALMEAMMMGIPCITTNCNGSRELVEDGKTGLVVPVGDAEKMAKAMQTLAKDDELKVHLAEKAKEASEEFRTEKIMEEWRKAILEW